MAEPLLLYNGAVHTLDPARPRARALVVHGSRIAAVGGEELGRPAGFRRRADLRGRCVLPGLVDAHLHFEMYSLGRERIDAETATAQELLARVAARAAAAPASAWIRGHGWNHHRWGGAFPTRQLLDEAAPRHPVYLTAKSGHAAWVNSRALVLAGVSAATPDPPGGTVVRDGTGSPTGVLLENAAGLVYRHLPEPTLEEAAAAMERSQQEALRRGLTGVHDLDGARALRAWQLLRERGGQRLRVVKSIPGSLLEQAVELGLRSGLGDEWLRIGGVKLFADGALGPRTAWMEAPYEGDPGHCGLPLQPREELEAAVRRAAAAGLACWVHAIGDRANREVLEILAAARALEPAGGRPLRHRVEHAQVLRPADLARFAAHGVVASMQPVHATSDMEMADRHWGARVRGAYAWRSLRAAGATLAFGSDAPVEPIDPLLGLHAAVTRRREDGTPGEAGWQPQERLTVAEALEGYTRGAALAGGTEADAGALAPGRLADLTILEADPFEVPPMEIGAIPVAATVVGGACAWAAAGFAGDLT